MLTQVQASYAMHSHPDDSPISYSDINSALRLNLQQTTSISSNYRNVMTRGEVLETLRSGQPELTDLNAIRSRQTPLIERRSRALAARGSQLGLNSEEWTVNDEYELAKLQIADVVAQRVWESDQVTRGIQGAQARLRVLEEQEYQTRLNAQVALFDEAYGVVKGNLFKQKMTNFAETMLPQNIQMEDDAIINSRLTAMKIVKVTRTRY